MRAYDYTAEEPAELLGNFLGAERADDPEEIAGEAEAEAKDETPPDDPAEVPPEIILNDSEKEHFTKLTEWFRPSKAPEQTQDIPPMFDPVIWDYLRLSEYGQIVGGSKTNKTLFTMGLACHICCGRDFCGIHLRKGRVFIVDYELHENTFLQRLEKICEGYNLPYDEVRQNLDFICARSSGKAPTADDLVLAARGGMFHRHVLLVIDSVYKIPGIQNENDNAERAQLYASFDRIAGTAKVGVFLVHHSTKGDQGNKNVRDVGSGAGSQVRAVDMHMVMREHQTDNCFVLDSVVRSFPPSFPRVLRLRWPCFEAAIDEDPALLKRPTRGGVSQTAPPPPQEIAKAGFWLNGPFTSSEVETLVVDAFACSKADAKRGVQNFINTNLCHAAQQKGTWMYDVKPVEEKLSQRDEVWELLDRKRKLTVKEVREYLPDIPRRSVYKHHVAYFEKHKLKRPQMRKGATEEGSNG